MTSKIIYGSVVLPDGSSTKAQIHVYSRNGWKSNKLIMIHVNGKRITPYEQRLRGYKLDLSTLMRIMYSESLRKLVYTKNPFLEMVKSY